MFGNLGAGEIILILLVILILFGAKKIPELAKTFGKAKVRQVRPQKDQVAVFIIRYVITYMSLSFPVELQTLPDSVR